MAGLLAPSLPRQSINSFRKTLMQSHLKSALMTTGIVLLTIYALRKVSFTAGVINTALNG